MGIERVTLKMIAEKVGTSIGTVDRALNNRDGVNKEMKRKVLEAAENLGYRPNKIASALGRKRSLNLAIVYPDGPAEFYDEISAGIDAAAKELVDYGVNVHCFRYSLKTSKMAEEVLEQIDFSEFDGLAINCAGLSDSFLLDEIAAKIPVITFNTDLPESERLFYIGSNARQGGMVAGELLTTYMGKKGTVKIIGHFIRIRPFLERLGGFLEYCSENVPEVEVLQYTECINTPEEAEKCFLEQIKNEPNITGIYCAGFSTTLGVTRALKKLNRKDICLVGFDLSKTTAQMLKEGWCNALLFQDPFKQGYQATHFLSRYLLEGWTPVKSKMDTELQIVIRSNLKSYEEVISGRSKILF